jgi:hypothetical protein
MEIKHPLTFEQINSEDSEWPIWYIRDADGLVIAIMGQTDLAKYVLAEQKAYEALKNEE